MTVGMTTSTSRARIPRMQVGLWLREIFEHFGLRSFPKTSGSKGLQIYVPLNTPVTYEVTKMFSHALAQLLEHDHRDLVLSEMSKQARTGKVFVDWSQNDEHKTTVAVYSLRAREHPTVSTPVSWEEVERAFKKKTWGCWCSRPSRWWRALRNWASCLSRCWN